ncbi:hypothetical protein R6Q59_001603 [Mikania micrantha]
MFSLFYGLLEFLASKTEFHVLLFGIDKAGKTVSFMLYSKNATSSSILQIFA